ncbi:hypothetical protein ACVXHA_14355 [Escherichia coli]
MRLTCKRKTLKKQRSAEKPTGVVESAVEVFNQHQTPVALYSIMTLVARQHGDFRLIGESRATANSCPLFH